MTQELFLWKYYSQTKHLIFLHYNSSTHQTEFENFQAYIIRCFIVWIFLHKLRAKPLHTHVSIGRVND